MAYCRRPLTEIRYAYIVAREVDRAKHEVASPY